MDKFDLLAKKYYDNAFQVACEISRQIQSNDKYADQAFLMSFDLTFQFSLLELLMSEEEAQPNQAKLLSKTANSANLAEFLKLTENIEFDFSYIQNIQQIQTALKAFFRLFFDCVNQAEPNQKFLLNQNLQLCFASLLHMDSPSTDDLNSLPRLKVLSAS